MAEYIEREALAAKAVYMHGFGKNKYVPLRVIESAPAADVVEVVRCKDCKHCKTIFPEKEIGKEPRQAWICMLFKCEIKPNDFCSYGERRESNGRS